jgi:hypothetical protein
MRLATIGMTAIVAASTAALAQVARDPVESKGEPLANMAPANSASADRAIGNNMVSNELPPTTGSKTESAAPRR